MGKSDIIRQNQDKEAMLKRSLEKLVELYSDKIHFIYELLQNAEDARADCICFRQYTDRLEVFHNGNPFTDSNLQSLCDAALSDKKNEDGMIGKFGLGFKSVFTICNIVELYSEPSNHPIYNDLESFAIKIENYIDPTDIDNKWNHENIYTTKFIFPYYVDGKFFNTVDKLKDDIAKKLRNLGADVLLFLKYIKEIKFTINEIGKDLDGEGVYKLDREQVDNKLCKVRQIDETKENNSSWFIFSKSIDNTEKSVDIAFSIIEKDNKVGFKGLDVSYISAYFPTEMKSGLNFIVQAPFELTPNRGELIRDSESNRYLYHLLAELLKETIFTFKYKNMLSLELISLLPYKTLLPHKDMDSLDEFLLKLHLCIADILKKEEIIPIIGNKNNLISKVNKDGRVLIIKTIDKKNYVTAKDAKIVRGAKLLELFDGNKLCELLKQPGAKWLPKDFTENRQLSELHSFFIDELGVEEIRSNKLAQYIENNPDFLINADDEWLVKFYNYLSNDVPKLLEKSGELATVSFIKTTDGNFNAPFIKPEGGKTYEAKPKIYLKPKSISSNVEDFIFVDNFIEQNCPELIKVLGIKEPNILQYFIHEMENGRNTKPNDDTNISQVKKAVQFLKSDSEKVIDPFKNLLWLKVVDTYGKTKCITCLNKTIYREEDFNGVSIKEYFGDVNCNIYILDEQFYLEKGLTFNDFVMLEKLGIKNTVYENLFQTKYLGSKGGPGKPADCSDIGDFRKILYFYNLEDVLEYIRKYSTVKLTEIKAKQKSKIIFYLLKNVEKHLQGVWQYGKANPENIKGVSRVVECLKSKKWLFNKNGSIVSPSEISRYDLDMDIYGKVDEKSNIYEVLGFKKTEQDKQSELVREILSRYTPEQINLIIQQIIPEETDFDPDRENNNEPFPNDPIKNLQHIRENIKRLYDKASKVKREYLLRRIRTSRGKDRDHIGHRYRGYCQICQSRVPYWDVAEIFEDPKKELEQMNLSLCLNCAREYRQLRENRKNKNLMSSFKTNILGANPEKDTVIMLGEKEVKFTNTHLAEIQEILKIENE